MWISRAAYECGTTKGHDFIVWKIWNVPAWNPFEGPPCPVTTHFQLKCRHCGYKHTQIVESGGGRLGRAVTELEALIESGVFRRGGL